MNTLVNGRPTFHLTFATPEKVLYEGPAISLTIPGQGGWFEVLAHHAPLIALTHPGTIALLTPTEKKEFTISEGVFEISENQAFLLLSS